MIGCSYAVGEGLSLFLEANRSCKEIVFFCILKLGYFFINTIESPWYLSGPGVSDTNFLNSTLLIVFLGPSLNYEIIVQL